MMDVGKFRRFQTNIQNFPKKFKRSESFFKSVLHAPSQPLFQVPEPVREACLYLFDSDNE